MAELQNLILKATDETLTTENWRLILEVCDEVSASPELNTKVAIQAIKSRMAKKDANTILRTLSLLVALAENCGSRMQQEIATTSFLQEYLIKKLGEKKLHRELKVRIVETIAQLNDSFKGDPSLKPITDAYRQVSSKYSQYLTTLPDKPAKTSLTPQERIQQDKELERALKLSAQEFEKEKSMQKIYLSEKPLPEALNESASKQTSQSAAKNVLRKENGAHSASIVRKVCALYDLVSYEPDELSFRKGDIITVIESVYRDWWRGSLSSGKIGIFPLNYVTPVQSKSMEEIVHQNQMETNLINIESRKIDALVTLLSSQPDASSEAQITLLFNSVISHKATLAKLIDSYSLRREELRTLNDQLSRETKLYNELLDGHASRRQSGSVSSARPYPPNHGLETFQTYSGVAPQLTQQASNVSFGNSSQLLYPSEEVKNDHASYFQKQGQPSYRGQNHTSSQSQGQIPYPRQG